MGSVVLVLGFQFFNDVRIGDKTAGLFCHVPVGGFLWKFFFALHTSILYITIQYMYRLILPIAGVLAFFPLAGQAASVFDYPAAVQEAKAHSPGYQKVEAAKEEATWRKREASAAFMPLIQITGNHYFSKK